MTTAEFRALDEKHEELKRRLRAGDESVCLEISKVIREKEEIALALFTIEEDN